MKRSFRTLSRLLIPILCCCIIITALTGVLFGLSDRLRPLPNIVANGLIAIHQGAFLGSNLSPLYVLLIGLGVFFLGLKTVMSGRYNLLFQFAPPILINFCRAIALILVIPVAVCAETGVAYRLGTDWFNISESQTASFLAIHSGIALGSLPGISYILVSGLGLIILSILSWRNGRFKQRQHQQSLKHEFEKAYLAEDFVPNSDNKIASSKPTLAAVLGVIVSIIFLSLLYWLTSIIVVAIAIALMVVAALTFLLWRRSTVGWQERKRTLTRLYEQEAESITMLRAIPDSMLRMTQDGICLSYIPAKEASHFMLDGNIIDRHISEFIAPEIATGLLGKAQISLQTGKTQLFQFPIYVDGMKKLHEARITNIGEIEVLILVREIDRYTNIEPDLSQTADVTPIELYTETDLLQTLETAVQDTELKQHNKILVCLAINKSETVSSDTTKEDLLQQTTVLIDSSFPSTTIFLLEDDNLVLLVDDLSVEQTSALVDELHRNLQEHFSVGGNNSNSSSLAEFKIGLLEIDPHDLDTASPANFAIAMVDAAKATCQMAKQKVNLKTFW